MPEVVHCKRAPQGSFVYIGRPALLGNPFAIDERTTREQVIEQFRQYFQARVATDEGFRAAVLAVRGRDLGCWCAPKACHGDVILEWLAAND